MPRRLPRCADACRCNNQYCEHTPATAMLERIRELEQQVKQLKLDRKRKDATIKVGAAANGHCDMR